MIIRVRGLHKSYRTGTSVTDVLRGVDLDVEEGELVSLVGPSGSGKTTLLHAIGGLDRDYQGTLVVDGHDLRQLGDTALSDYRNRTVGFVFQAFYLLGHLTCLENVALPALFARGPVPPADALEGRARAALEQVGLADKADVIPATLSGGQRQRVAIARALFNRPRVLLCDEPTGNLDRKLGTAIVQLFRELNAEHGLTVVIVTHDPTVAAATTRKLLVLDGRVREVEDAAEAMLEPTRVEASP